jgi:ankyrin repeat protein
MYAAQNGSAQVARALLRTKKSVDWDAQNKEGWTALMIAARNGHAQVARVLLENGADVNAVQQNEAKWTALMIAAKNGHAQVARVLLEKGANTDAKGRYEYTALQLAVENGHAQVTRVLLDKGASIDDEDARGTFMLSRAVEYASDNPRAQTQVVRALIAHGAKVKPYLLAMMGSLPMAGKQDIIAHADADSLRYVLDNLSSSDFDFLYDSPDFETIKALIEARLRRLSAAE